MTKKLYSLRIKVSNINLIQQINDILKVKSSYQDIWIYELEQKDNDSYIDFIWIFTNILDNKVQILESIGISRKSIKIWALYNIEDQVNLEFNSEDMLKLWKEGISLCISVY